MNDYLKILSNIVVLLFVALPPFLFFLNLINSKIKNLYIKGIICIIYWTGTILLNNIVPAIVVLIIIYCSKKDSYRNKLSEKKFFKIFNLDYIDEKFQFSITNFITICFMGIIVKYFVSLINFVIILLLNRCNIILKEQQIVNIFLSSDFLNMILYIIMIVFFAPIVEEFVFRFFLYNRVLKKRFTIYISAIISSLIFSVIHYNLQGATAFFLIGIVNCYLYEKNGYWAAVANHFIFNLISVIALLFIK